MNSIKTIIFAFLSFSLLILPGKTGSQVINLPLPEPPEHKLIEEGFDLPHIPRITCKQLKELMDKKADLVIVDARIPLAFKFEHIKGAINIPEKPYGTFTEEMIKTKLLSLPRNKPIIIYCD